jgi:hypothetical protein
MFAHAVLWLAVLVAGVLRDCAPLYATGRGVKSIHSFCRFFGQDHLFPPVAEIYHLIKKQTRGSLQLS